MIPTQWLLGLSAASLLVSLLLAGARWSRAWLAAVLLGTGSAFVAAIRVITSDDWQWQGGLLLGGDSLRVLLDGISALFLVLVCVIGAAGATYAREYWSDGAFPASAARGRAWWSGLLLSMGLVVTAGQGLQFLIAWESFAVSGYFLITLDRRRRDVRAAGWLYLAASHTGTLVLFAFFALLAARTGSWALGPMGHLPALAPLFWLMLVGFGMKAGFFPLHIWLPSAHANAPSHVSAIMSGVAIKMGVYGIVRFSGWLPAPPAAGWVIMVLGAVSALIGIVFAFAQTDVKRLLAYCSVENVGVILAGVGAAVMARSTSSASWGRLALAGALLHVWNHGAFKSLLFLSAGSIVHATGTREVSRLGGLWRAMPGTAVVFAVGASAVSALPPLNGFVSEWLIYVGLLDASATGGPAAWGPAVAAIMLATAGAVTLASFVKAGGLIFLGAPRTQPAARAHESGPWMLAPMLGLAAVCLVAGLLPAVFWPVASRATAAWMPGWEPTAIPPGLVALGRVHVGLALAVSAAVVYLRHRATQNGLRTAPTWDCGYNAPRARMQYTGMSFASIVTGWFGWVLRPRRMQRRPRGAMPATALRAGAVPETILERVVQPVGWAVGRLAGAARALQHGGLQLYVLYVLVGLLALGGLVAMEGAR